MATQYTLTSAVLGPHFPKVKILSDGSVRYSYQPTPDVTCVFSLYSEIGEPFKPLFDAILREHGKAVAARHMDLLAYPWAADVLEIARGDIVLPEETPRLRSLLAGAREVGAAEFMGHVGKLDVSPRVDVASFKGRYHWSEWRTRAGTLVGVSYSDPWLMAPSRFFLKG